MLQTNAVDLRGPGRWSLVVRSSLLTLMVLLGGMGPEADATQLPDQKEKPNKEEAQKARPRVNPMELPPGLDLNDLFQGANGLDAQQMQRIQQQLDQFNQEMRKALERQGGMQGRFNPNLFQGLQGLQGLRRGRGAERDNGPNVRLGARIAHPSDALIDQLDLPQGQGLVIEELTADSAAGKAGVKVNDILLELNGKPVSDNPEEFKRQLADIKARDPVDAVVLRKGRKEMVKGLSLPEAIAERQQPIVPQPGLRFPMLNVNPPALGGAAPEGASVTLTRNNDQFTTRQQQGGEVVTVIGHVDEGKAVVDQVIVQEGGKTTKYFSIDKVPEVQRATVLKLADMALKGNVRSEQTDR